MKIVELSAAEWSAACPAVDDVYQDSRWLDVIASVYPKIGLLRLACVDDRDVPLWLLPLVSIYPMFRRSPILISVAFGNYGGFIHVCDLEHPEWATSLQALQLYFESTNASALEIRGMKLDAPFVSNDYFRRFVLDLPKDPKVLWDNGLSSIARNRIRKAEKFGVTTQIDAPNSLRIFQHFYEMQAKQHGTPIHALPWFEEMSRLFEGRCYTATAFKKELPVGSVLMLDGKNTSVLHAVVWSREFRDVPIADLLYWAGIKESIHRKKTHMDFGRTRPVEGQLFFKRKWGAVETSLPYSYLLKPGRAIPLLVPEKGTFKIATKIWHALPMALLRHIGPHVRPRIPT